ncbi:MAG TPA: hypothetical protein VEL07_22355 [Planctomycetota bacterium]|nr:hypothetical protein [Planctomycetota bacterium]
MAVAGSDPADLAIAAHLVHALIVTEPQALLWVPGRERFGLALVAGGDRAVIALDGCLAIAATRWPWHGALCAAVVADALAAPLAGRLRLGAFGGARTFAYPLPDARDGAVCVLAATAGLPWFAPDQRIVAAA